MDTPSTRIHEAVTGWPDISLETGRHGEREYTLGRRQVGHLHENRCVHIPFPTDLRDRLIDRGEASPHEYRPDTGWVSVQLSEPGDAKRALKLLRRSYERALESRKRKVSFNSPTEDA